MSSSKNNVVLKMKKMSLSKKSKRVLNKIIPKLFPKQHFIHCQNLYFYFLKILIFKHHWNIFKQKIFFEQCDDYCTLRNNSYFCHIKNSNISCFSWDSLKFQKISFNKISTFFQIHNFSHQVCFQKYCKKQKNEKQISFSKFKSFQPFHFKKYFKKHSFFDLKVPFQTNIKKRIVTNEVTCQSYHSNFDKLLFLFNNFFRSNQNTCLIHKPSFSEGDWVQKGQILTDTSSNVLGELAIGTNLLVAYMPWNGYNFEDAILVSENLAKNSFYSSIHIEKYETEIKQTKLGLEQITNEIPNETHLTSLDKSGIIKIGSWVQEGDILVGKLSPLTQQVFSPYEKLLYDVVGKNRPKFKDTSLRVPKGVHGRVINIEILGLMNSLVEKTNPQPLVNVTKMPQTVNVQKRFTNDSNLSSAYCNILYRVHDEGAIQFYQLKFDHLSNSILKQYLKYY
eukprot:TRINITY_DN8296_c0_g1_i2.p1 TRINITY_DN8296_c0_g1~~TRINITY_DN8296_c0_g1_i2.p1  ORF type:complete len:488 (+),score=1.13 TRINITY_DN8296_c0_g1_i2:117-1466(+)